MREDDLRQGGGRSRDASPLRLRTAAGGGGARTAVAGGRDDEDDHLHAEHVLAHSRSRDYP